MYDSVGNRNGINKSQYLQSELTRIADIEIITLADIITLAYMTEVKGRYAKVTHLPPWASSNCHVTKY